MKKLLYLFDDINYESGAQKVTLHQMQVLSNDYHISVFSLRRPENLETLKGITVIGDEFWEKTEIYTRNLREVLHSYEYSPKKKLKRLLYTAARYFSLEEFFFQKVLLRNLKAISERFDTVIVVSESSRLRAFAARLKHPKKIQWIHTDYEQWSSFSCWTRRITKHDKHLYKKFDRIIVLSEHCKKGMLHKLPMLAQKVAVVPNLIDGDKIRREAKAEPVILVKSEVCCFVTVGRMEKEKAIERILEICKKMSGEGYLYRWYLIGGGSRETFVQTFIQENKLSEQVIPLGRLNNPYPVIKQCDCLVLLSKYEGRPVTVDEAMVLGIPVLAADTGGIREQIGQWRGGTVIPNQAEFFYPALLEQMKYKTQNIEPFDDVQFNKTVLRKLFDYF